MSGRMRVEHRFPVRTQPSFTLSALIAQAGYQTVHLCTELFGDPGSSSAEEMVLVSFEYRWREVLTETQMVSLLRDNRLRSANLFELAILSAQHPAIRHLQHKPQAWPMPDVVAFGTSRIEQGRRLVPRIAFNDSGLGWSMSEVEVLENMPTHVFYAAVPIEES